MLIGAIALGLALGLFAGGNIWNLAVVRLRWIGVLLVAVVVRFVTEAAIAGGVGVAEQLRLPLFAGAYALLLAGLWANRSQPGMSLAFVGILFNVTAIVLNGGRMPIWEPSLRAAGLTPDDARTVFHTVLPATLDAEFLRRAGPLADLIPIPLPFFRNVASIGDVFLGAGLAFFLFATVVRTPRETDEDEAELERRRVQLLEGEAAVRRHPWRRETASLAPGLEDAATLELPLAAAVDAGALAPTPPPIAATAGGAAVAVPAIGVEAPVAEAPSRRHPYVRLALNGSFVALWTGQLISLIGDRIHYIAIATLVLNATGSVIATAAVFLFATLPNVLFSPIAGTLVDRWNQREVLIVSDLLRAAVVLLMPLAAVTNILLVYPLTFLVATISVFFRPARVAVVPRIVREDELLTANSALWIAETFADIGGFAIAGLFVAFLGPALPLAFWFDAATYVASAALIWTIAVPPVARVAESDAQSRFADELRAGWRFLRGDRVLLANTIQATVAQFTLGILVALTAVYAARAIVDARFGWEAVLGFLEAGIGVGNLVGGFLVGLVGTRFGNGRLIILGYALCGAFIALLGLTTALPIALGLMAGAGFANMVFVIPSQTLFQLRTPGELMGRVVSFRFALVGGAWAVAMAVGGVLGEVVGVATTLGVFGLVMLAAGLAGMLVPPLRDA
ncbi:MAG TPA: MFS transporter [Candidatus Limnocylindrales bacterium]